MATCYTLTTIYAFATSAATAKTAYAVPVSGTCSASSIYALTQSEYNAYQAGITTDTTQTTNITNQTSALQVQTARIDTLVAAIGDKTPNGEVMQAQGVIFGVVFAAMAIIWGMRQVYKTFTGTNVGHD